MQLKTLDGIDLVYSFDCLFPPMLLKHMAVLFNNSSTAKTLVSFNNKQCLENAGYERLRLKAKIPVRMTGSSEGKTAYIYVKQLKQGRKEGCLSNSGITTDINEVDPLFRKQFDLYLSGELDERNGSIDVKSFCSPRKLRLRARNSKNSPL